MQGQEGDEKKGGKRRGDMKVGKGDEEKRGEGRKRRGEEKEGGICLYFKSHDVFQSNRIGSEI